jgi:PEP-utilising enzyme, mobile domain
MRLSSRIEERYEEGKMAEREETFHPVGQGLTVFEHEEPVQGPVVWLDSPQAVMDFVATGQAPESIVLARGGTTTFLTPALTAGVKAVMTLQGAPESHLGILSREYGIPCLMSVRFSEGVRSSRGEVIPPDGAIVRLDVSGSPEGSVHIDAGARDYDTSAGPGESEPVDPEAEAQAEQLRALMNSYRGEIGRGSSGDRQIRARLRTSVVETSDESVVRELSAEEIGDFLAYTGWNLWDLIAARQTEGESGLIPRQEYETVSFVQQWATYTQWYERIAEEIGVDGVVELGRTPRREIGTKLNHVHMWCGTCPLIGRAIAMNLGLDGWEHAGDLGTIAQFTRRLQHGLWGGGPGFVSGRGYQVPVLEDSWIERFREEEQRLEDHDELAAFRRFNAATELCGFLLHYDCRAGLCDTGPYPLPDGGFVIVRDHFLHEPGYEWATVVDDLPHAVTEAMFFRPAGEMSIAINDIATTFANPRNYLKHLSGAVVYARDRWDTPIGEIRRLQAPEMERIVERCNAAMLELYETIGAKSREERIRDGVKVYTRDMIMPYARRAGLWDQFVQEMEFDRLSPLAEAAWPLLTDEGGAAQQVLGGVFLMGQGLVPEGGFGPAPEVGADALPQLHAIALKGNLKHPGDVNALEQAGLVAETAAGFMLTEQGHRVHDELLAAERERLDMERLAGAYERFLAINGPMKSLSARAHSVDEDERFELIAQLEELIERVEPALRRTMEVVPRFEGYPQRLRDALARAAEGQPEYITSPTVDSVHTVWMEIHEDYLQTLGRSREEEGSY